MAYKNENGTKAGGAPYGWKWKGEKGRKKLVEAPAEQRVLAEILGDEAGVHGLASDSRRAEPQEDQAEARRRVERPNREEHSGARQGVRMIKEIAMTRPQIEIIVGIDEKLGFEVALVDRPDTLRDDVPIDSLADGLTVACAGGLVDNCALELICSGRSCDASAEDVRADAEMLKEQCGALDELRIWFLENEYRLAEEQIEEWSKAMAGDGMFERNPYDGDWVLIIKDLAECREAWSEA